MMALTICQPYAHLIVTPQAELPPGVEVKRIENRRWDTRYRGPLLIHAGKSRDWLTLSEDGRHERAYGLTLAEMRFGQVVGIAELLDCVPYSRLRADLHKSRHAEGPICWVLGEVKRLDTPFDLRGKPGLFEAGTPPELCEQAPIYCDFGD